MYYLFYGLIWLITWLPLPILYILSDFIFLFVYYVVGYRKNVVRNNLKNSFPTKSAKELKKIERKFYRYFCDVFIESLYEMHISKKEMMKRMNFSQLELVLEQYEKGKSCMLMTAHYGNWEWASGLSLFLPSDKPLYGVYKRLTSKHFDDLMCELRMKSTGLNVEKNDLLRKLFQLRKDKQLAMFGMISDQRPPRNSLHYWTTFLNQDTPIITGTEVLSRKFDYPVFYSEITRIKRGYYNCEFIPISLEPSKTSEFEISEKYIRLLEKTIETKPEFWLWTHRRWKFKREDAI
ncbi:MAG: lysophospholipid acyltransferase family protein [Paludibacter sp.]|nr:lysophospholipid acyltransferase family protein [Paludibacter sp.]